MVLLCKNCYYINDHVDDRTKKSTIKKTVNKLILIHLHSLIKNRCLFVINVIQYYKSRSEKIKPKSFCPSIKTSKLKFHNITPIHGQTLQQKQRKTQLRTVSNILYHMNYTDICAKGDIKDMYAKCSYYMSI